MTGARDSIGHRCTMCHMEMVRSFLCCCNCVFVFSFNLVDWLVIMQATEGREGTRKRRKETTDEREKASCGCLDLEVLGRD